MAVEILDFEAPLLEIQKRIEALTGFPPEAARDKQLARLQERLERARRDVFSRLSPWQRVQLARHPYRPYTLDIVQILFRDFIELKGDRRFADDAAVVAGLAWFHNRPVVVVGQQKGRDTKQKIQRNFGMPKPEGYRKALRVMKLAEKFKRPIFCFIDTPGAYPGIDAEERGQAEAIAYNIRELSRLRAPIVVTVIGEGGSGGALAIGVGDAVLMLENSIYSVISPEGCAAILWKDAKQAEEAAANLKLTASDLLGLQLVDEVVPEPPGGAHTDHVAAAAILDRVLLRRLEELETVDPRELVEARHRKLSRLGSLALDVAVRS